MESPIESTHQNPAAIAKRLCAGLQSDDRKVRKQTFIELEKYLFLTELSHDELRNIFSETHMYILNGLRDKAETVREQAIKFITFQIINKLPMNDYYLTYIFPVLIERIGTVELVEESEEIRLQLLHLLSDIISKYSNTVQLKPFLNDAVIILAETVKDKYPNIKELSCRTIVNLAQALPRDFHQQAETLIKPVLTCFPHQRYKIRVEGIRCIGEIVMHSTYKGLDEVLCPLAEKLFDQIPTVRRTVAQVAARWLLDYRDRYSFFHKILPLLLTGLNDEIPETRLEAHELWEKVGLQYMKENEKDLKDEMDYLTEPPRFYPEGGLKRPNLGCRVLVQRNVGKLAGAIGRELASWQEDVRVRCGQLLCALALHAESGLTQHLQELLPSMYWAARDGDQRVVCNIKRASEIIGVFVPFETWWKLILPVIEDEPHYGHLTVLGWLCKGSPKELLPEHVPEISDILSQDSICCNRKQKYQQELLHCVKVLSEKYLIGKDDSNDFKTGYNLFKISVILLALKHKANEEIITVDLFDNITNMLNLPNNQELWVQYCRNLLIHINVDPQSWTTVSDQACIFHTILEQCNEAFGQNLDVIEGILESALHKEVEAETRLKTYFVLANVFENKEKLFQRADKLERFMEKLIEDVFVPGLVWKPGASEEAIRTMAASCLRSALIPAVGESADLFRSGTELRSIFDKLFPLILSLMEDASYRSRQLGLECLVLLKTQCTAKNIWSLEDLIKSYPEVLKRLDDPTEKVRLCALSSLKELLTEAPEQFSKETFRVHHELIVDTLLIHFDDDNETIQALVFDILKVVVNFGKNELVRKVEVHKPLLRNQKGCTELLEYVNVYI